MNRWTTLPDGRIEVNGKLPLMRGGLPDKVWQWAELAGQKGEKFNVPVHWILGHIYAESGGNPNALNTSDRPHGAGLMQITHPSLRGGRTDAQLMDPDLSVDIGAGLLGRLKSSGAEDARDLPSVASRYNAGTAKSGKPHRGPEPWGMRATGNHIDRVVAASNSAHQLLHGDQATEPGKPGADLLPFFLVFQLLRFLN